MCIKRLSYCRNNDRIMENMDKGLTVTKWAGVDRLAENTPNSPEFICPICLSKPMYYLDMSCPA